MKRIATGVASIMFAIAVGLANGVPSAYAASKQKVNCDKVSQEVHSGKKTKEIASDLGISVSSVYRCNRKEKAAEKAAAKTGSTVAANPVASPAAKPKP